MTGRVTGHVTGQSIWRNLFHLSGIVIPLLYLLVSKATALSLTILLLCLISAVEFLRITGRLKLEMVRKWFKEKEQNKPTGAPAFLFASLVTILFFRKEVSICSLFVLCIADPCSSLVGRKLGKHPLFGKSIEGTLAFLGSSLIILTLSSISPIVTFSVAIIATATELFTPSVIDDNLTIPIITGLALTVLGA